MPSEWLAPPEFEQDGSPPPLESAMWRVGDRFMLAPAPHRLLCVEAMASIRHYRLESTTRPRLGFAEVDHWLIDNLGSPRLKYAERSEATRLDDYRITTSILRNYWGNMIMPQTIVRNVEPADMLRRIYGDTSVVRVQEYRYWRRDDPILQLSPGTTKKVGSKVVTGVAHAQADELASQLGFKVTSGVAEFSSQLSDRVGTTLTLSAQQEVTEETTFSNDQSTGLRRISMWRQGSRLVFERLTATMLPLRSPATTRVGAPGEIYEVWSPLATLDQAGDSISATTYIDIPLIQRP